MVFSPTITIIDVGLISVEVGKIWAIAKRSDIDGIGPVADIGGERHSQAEQ
jgi:hypothetical protein